MPGEISIPRAYRYFDNNQKRINMPRKFSKDKLNKFREVFVEKRKAIINSLKNKDEELDVDGDDLDRIQGVIISDLANQLSQRDIKTVEKLTAAIEKIDSGEFGTCEECDGRIGEKRLLAIPGVAHCIDCAEDIERNKKQYAS